MPFRSVISPHVFTSTERYKSTIPLYPPLFRKEGWGGTTGTYKKSNKRINPFHNEGLGICHTAKSLDLPVLPLYGSSIINIRPFRRRICQLCHHQ